MPVDSNRRWYLSKCAAGGPLKMPHKHGGAKAHEDVDGPLKKSRGSMQTYLTYDVLLMRLYPWWQPLEARPGASVLGPLRLE